MAEVLLEVKDLKTYFPTRDELVKAVDGVSFCVYKGETFGLVGESGCGKSQTCRSILGLLKKPGRVVNGQILLNGQNLVGLKERELRKYRGKQMSVIFQEPMTSLSPVMKIKKQIMEIYDDQPMTRREKKQKAIDLLRMVGIPSPETRVEEYTHQFSGGMRQRVMIAMSIALDPEILIADEPTTALDVTVQAQIMELLKELQAETGMGLILITHDLGVVADVADRINVMYAGRIVESAGSRELYARPAHPYTEGLLDSIPRLDQTTGELSAIGGLPPNLTRIPAGCSFNPRCKYARDICRVDPEPPLVELGGGRSSACHFTHELLAGRLAPVAVLAENAVADPVPAAEEGINE